MCVFEKQKSGQWEIVILYRQSGVTCIDEHHEASGNEGLYSF